MGALQVSSHGSRLAVTLEAGEPQYESIIAADSNSAEYLNTLSGVIQRELAQRVVIPFVGTQASSDALKERDVNKETANRFGLYFAKVKLNVQSQVTNIGAKPSSVKEIVWYLVEDADGHRETLDVVSRVPSTNLKPPESEPVSLAKEGEIVEFSGFGGWRHRYQATRECAPASSNF